MGQKVSSLGDVFSWKNGESSRNGDSSRNCDSSRNGESSRSNDAPAASNDGRPVVAGSVCSTDNGAPSNKAPDRQHFENIYVANVADMQPSSSSSLTLSPPDVICPEHPRCCIASTSDATAADTADTATKNMQTSKGASSSKKLNNWVLRFNCSRPKSKSTKCCTTPPESVPETNEVKCVCTRYQRTDDQHLGAGIVFDAPQAVQEEQSDDEEQTPPQHDGFDFDGAFNTFNTFHGHSELVLPSFDDVVPLDLHSDMSGEEFMNEDFEDRAYRERAKEIQEGIDPPPGFRPGVIQLLELGWPKRTIDSLTSLFNYRAAVTAFTTNDLDDTHRIHTSIDYIHYLVPDLLQITNCSFYWGKMDRYEAEKLLENRPEGTFLLRDSAQEEYLFSVSFRKYGRSLHARIEQWNHLFSFDSRDPGVFASPTVCGLIEHYKDPSCCMFFEPMLTIPFPRKFTFSLQHTCRATICSQITYDDVNQLKLPKLLKSYLKEYHYKQRVRIRQFDLET